jgi:hypothetical protein
MRLRRQVLTSSKGLLDPPTPQSYFNSIAIIGRLHELDCCSIGIANVDDALPGIRARFEDLRFADSAPTRPCNRAYYSVKIIYGERNMDRSDIARSEIGTLPVWWRVVLEQFNPVPGRLKNGD